MYTSTNRGWCERGLVDRFLAHSTKAVADLLHSVVCNALWDPQVKKEVNYPMNFGSLMIPEGIVVHLSVGVQYVSITFSEVVSYGLYVGVALFGFCFIFHGTPPGVVFCVFWLYFLSYSSSNVLFWSAAWMPVSLGDRGW